MNTGPTGSTEQVDVPGNTGYTGLTGPLMLPLVFATAGTGTVEPPHIATLEELMTSHAATINKEGEDKTLLQCLLNPGASDFRPELFQWAAAGFPAIYVVKTFSLAPPSICSDGVARSVYEYVEYLLGVTHGVFLDTLMSRVTGIEFSYSYQGDSLRIHVSKN